MARTLVVQRAERRALSMAHPRAPMWAGQRAVLMARWKAALRAVLMVER